MNITIVGSRDEIERHRPALDALRAALGDCQVGGPVPVDRRDAATQYRIVIVTTGTPCGG